MISGKGWSLSEGYGLHPGLGYVTVFCIYFGCVRYVGEKKVMRVFVLVTRLVGAVWLCKVRAMGSGDKATERRSR